MLQLPRSSFYYTSQRADDAQLREQIETICLKETRHGQRRVKDALNRQSIPIGREKVGRLIKEMGLSVQPRRRKIQTTNSPKGKPLYPNLIKGLEIVRPNQVVCGDITHIPLMNGRTAYLAILIDVFTRVIRGWELARQMSVGLIDTALDRALENGNCPEIHHADHGGQYIAHSYCQRLESFGCRISMSAKGRPWENGFVESVIGHIKDELVWVEEYADFEQAYSSLSHFLDVVYNNRRSHSSLGYLTPTEFETRYHQTQTSLES